jgi:hypothetical protein
MTDGIDGLREQIARAIYDVEPPTYSGTFPPVVILFEDLSAKRRERIDAFATAALKPMLAERERLREALSHAEQVLTKYRDETPLGHQPHMIALVADRAISAARAALTQSGEGS